MIVIDCKWARPRLKLLRAVVDSKVLLPVLEYVLVEHTAGETSVTGTNLDAYLRCGVMDDRASQPGRILVPFRLLSKIVRNTEATAIQIEQTDGGTTITAGDSVWNFAIMELEQWPNVPQKKGLSTDLITLPAVGLKRAIKMTGFCSTKERSRFRLDMTKTIFDNSMTAVTTDGHRMMVFIDSSVKGRADIQLSRIATAVLGAAKYEMVEMQRFDKHIFCQTEDLLFIVREAEGNFPNYRTVLPNEEQEDRQSVIFGGAKMMRACREVIDSSIERSGRKMQLQIKSDRISVESIRSEIAFKTSIPGHYDSKEVHTIWLDPEYLLSYLKVIEPGDVEMRFIDSHQTLEFRTVEKFQYETRFVMMPLRK